MDEKMKNKEIKEIYEGLQQVSGNIQGVRINYAISRTIRHLKPIAESLDDAIKPSEQYIEFEQKRVEMMEKYCDRDDKGNPMKEVIGKSVQYSITQKLGQFQKALETLSKPYKKAISQREKQIADYALLLEKECEETVKLHMISLDDVPETITRENFRRIEILIQEE
jgi:hypothetical protein